MKRWNQRRELNKSTVDVHHVYVMVRARRRGGYTRLLSAYQILSEPDIALRINVDADSDSVKGGAEKVDAVPAGWRLVHHALLDIVHAGVRRGIWSGIANAFAAIAVTGEAFVRDALALRASIGAGMAEAAMVHIPAMQASPSGQSSVPGIWVQPACCPITVNKGEKLLGELRFLGAHWWRRSVRRCSHASSRNIRRYLRCWSWGILFRKYHHWPGCVCLLVDMELIVEPG